MSMFMFGVGKVIRDPEVKDFGDTKVARLTVVSNKGRKKKDEDDWTNVGTFVELECFGYLADNIEKYTKGTQVEFSGEVEQQSWEDKNTGVKRSKLTVKASVIRKIANKSSDSGTKDGEIPVDDNVPF